jgi:hypothetical protein
VPDTYNLYDKFILANRVDQSKTSTPCGVPVRDRRSQRFANSMRILRQRTVNELETSGSNWFGEFLRQCSSRRRR